MMISVAKWNSTPASGRKTIRGQHFLVVGPNQRLEPVTIAETFKRDKVLAAFREQQYQDRLETSRK